MRIHLLGAFAVAVDGELVPESAWRLRKAETLVKLLALAPGNRLHREQVIAVLWPDRAPEAAANNLHQVLHVARRQLDGGSAGRRCLRLDDFRDGVWLVELAPVSQPELIADAVAAALGLKPGRGARAVSRGELPLTGPASEDAQAGPV